MNVNRYTLCDQWLRRIMSLPHELLACRGMAASLVVGAALSMVVTSTAAAQTIKVTITADNAYNLGFGTASGVTTLAGDVENFSSASQIFSCSGGPEVYPSIPYVANGYFYVVAYSDKSGTQGLLAQLTALTSSGTTITYSGASAWQVYATGVNYGQGSGGPTLAVVNQQIALANAGAGGAGSSHGWVSPAGGPTGAGYVGTLAVGEANDSAAGDFGQACPTSLNPTAPNSINDAARWMWYNPSGLADPFSSFVAGEFLIFRLEYSQVVNPRSIGVNKDIMNSTGQPATGVDILIGGHHSQLSDAWPHTGLAFNVVPMGANDLLRWSGGNTAPGAVVHVGFKLPEPSVDILGLFMTQGTTQIGCEPQVNVASGGTHFIDGGSITNIIYTNSVTACESVPLYVGNLVVKYFASEVDLGLLNPTSFGSLSPIRTDIIPGSPALVDPGASAGVTIPAPPAGANWAAMHYTVGTSSTLAGPGNTEDFVQVPVPAGSAPGGGCAASTTALCLQGGRFQVTAHFDAGGGNAGSANAVQLTPDTGYLWFFSSANVEAVVKVLDACALNSRFWVFAGGLTDVNVTLTVTDTKTSTTRTYVNPAHTAFLPIQDTSAFATCP